MGDYLYDLGVLKRLSKRDDGAVRLCTYGLVSNLRMDRVCKVKCGGSHGKLYRLSLWGEHIDGVLQKFALYVVHEGFALLNLVVPCLEFGGYP